MLNFKQYIIETNSSIHESVGDAINDLVDRIKNDGYKPGLEKQVADEWEINPALLLRMFKQKYNNKEPKDFSISSVDDKIIANAKEKAKQYRNSFSGEFSKYVGKVFQRPERPDKQYVFVAWTGKDIHAIEIPRQKEVRIRFANANSASFFLQKNIMN
jgi:hypothetical protein